MRLCKMTEENFACRFYLEDDKYWCCWGRWYGSKHTKECRLYKTEDSK